MCPVHQTHYGPYSENADIGPMSSEFARTISRESKCPNTTYKVPKATTVLVLGVSKTQGPKYRPQNSKALNTCYKDAYEKDPTILEIAV